MFRHSYFCREDKFDREIAKMKRDDFLFYEVKLFSEYDIIENDIIENDKKKHKLKMRNVFVFIKYYMKNNKIKRVLI